MSPQAVTAVILGLAAVGFLVVSSSLLYWLWRSATHRPSVDDPAPECRSGPDPVAFNVSAHGSGEVEIHFGEASYTAPAEQARIMARKIMSAADAADALKPKT